MSDTPSHVHPGIRAALMVLLNHVEPGWENCKEVVQMWLDGKFEQPQERAAGSEARPHADDQRTVSQSSTIFDTPITDASVVRFTVAPEIDRFPAGEWVAAGVARGLEQERNAVLADLRKCEQQLIAATPVTHTSQPDEAPPIDSTVRPSAWD